MKVRTRQRPEFDDIIRRSGGDEKNFSFHSSKIRPPLIKIMQKDLLFQIKKSLPRLLDLNEMVDDANKDNNSDNIVFYPVGFGVTLS